MALVDVHVAVPNSSSECEWEGSAREYKRIPCVGEIVRENHQPYQVAIVLHSDEASLDAEIWVVPVDLEKLVTGALPKPARTPQPPTYYPFEIGR